MSNFTDTAKINALAGNQYNGGWSAIEHQLRIIQSEWDETCDDGVKARNIHELRDGIADVLFTVYGLAHRAGIDADSDFEKVVESQFTKFDPTVEDAALTRDKYKALGIEVYQELRQITRHNIITDCWVTYSAKDQLDAKGRECPEGKWLKSHRFQEPVFDPLPDHVNHTLTL